MIINTEYIETVSILEGCTIFGMRRALYVIKKWDNFTLVWPECEKWAEYVQNEMGRNNIKN